MGTVDSGPKCQNRFEKYMIHASDYDFEMPKTLIAQHPLENREDARLMVVERSENLIDHRHVRDLDEILHPHDCLVVNNTRVISAKLVGFRKRTGGRWKGLFLESVADDHWRVLAKTRGRIGVGETVVLQDRNGLDALEVTLVTREEGGAWVISPNSDKDTETLLKEVGRVPLPHYIRDGNMVDADLKDYQTVYAKEPGAVAAPTAGLHFTAPLLKRLINRGVNLTQVTLHVGIGTFRPVTADNLDDHVMHSEWGKIDENGVELIKESQALGGRLIAVGTTSLRVLESAASDGELKPWEGETNLFVKPGYRFKAVEGLMTNFHLPRSTLVVLVRTFGGDELLKRAYAEAIEEKYRFFSYGDAMLIT